MIFSNSLAEKIGEVYSLGRLYLESQLELTQLKFKERFVVVFSTFVTAFLIFTFVGVFALFGAIALAFYLAGLLGSQALGFLAVSVLFGLIALLIYWLRKPLILRPVLQLVIQTIEVEDEEAFKQKLD